MKASPQGCDIKGDFLDRLCGLSRDIRVTMAEMCSGETPVKRAPSLQAEVRDLTEKMNWTLERMNEHGC